MLTGPLDDAYAAGARKDGGVSQADEQAVLDHAGNGRKPGGERLRIVDPAERRVEDEVPPIRDESMAFLCQAHYGIARTTALQCGRLDRSARRFETEADHLDRQREATERRHPFGLVGN